jgi:hypothetical protein
MIKVENECECVNDFEMCANDENNSNVMKPVIVNGIVIYYSTVRESWDCYQFYDNRDGLICTVPKINIIEFGGL